MRIIYLEIIFVFSPKLYILYIYMHIFVVLLVRPLAPTNHEFLGVASNVDDNCSSWHEFNTLNTWRWFV